ncbi:unnamed protein product [Cunninghamella blakesleeana]
MTSQDATSLLGTYLLQGWIMTNLICSKENCGVPLMRSKDKSIQFCVVHDSLPTSMNSNHYDTSSKTKNATNKEDTKEESTSTFEDKANSQLLKATTFTTDISDTVSETAIKDKDIDDFRLKEKRREQSSLASQLIGQRMLQRWVLLNDTCPNDECYAIPLIRHPTDKSMFCVICEQTYQFAKDVDTTSKSINNENDKKEKAVTDFLNESNIDDAITTQKTSINTQLHTPPLSTPPLDRSIKRQKKTEPDTPKIDSVESSELKTPSPSSIPSSYTLPQSKTDCREEARSANEFVIKCLSTKMRKMMDEVEACGDHYQLIKIVQAVEACSKTIKTCTDTLDNI